MPTVLITGANRGIGLEFARQYAAEGWRVFASCRAPAEARELDALAGDSDGAISVHPLDVGDPTSVAGAARVLAGEAIDLLVNNAGLSGPRGIGFGDIDYEAWEEVLRVNVLGPLRVAEAFVDQVARSDGRKIVALSSRMGSIADNSGGGGYIYRSSKAALNAAMRSLALDLAGRGIACCVFHPGWVKTRMGGPSAAIDVGTSVAGMRKVIAGLSATASGRFFNYDGAEIPW